MPKKVIPKEILYVRIKKEHREYVRALRVLFKTEGRYIDRLIANDMANNTCKRIKIEENLLFEKLKGD